MTIWILEDVTASANGKGFHMICTRHRAHLMGDFALSPVLGPAFENAHEFPASWGAAVKVKFSCVLRHPGRSHDITKSPRRAQVTRERWARHPEREH